MEEDHIEEREASQQQFSEYKNALQSKEQKLEEDHKARVADMKTQVMDLKKGFDNRV